MVLTEYLNYFNTYPLVKISDFFKGIIGIGDRVSNNLFLETGVYSLWSRDAADPVDTRKSPGNNMYGTNPFYMAKAIDDSWYGVFTNLANAQDWHVYNPGGIANIATYATGGIVDMYIMTGAGPDEITWKY